MFLRMLVRAAVLRRGRALSALLAMVVAAAVTTAMLTLYVDVQAKLRREFRNYGANIILVGRDGASLPPDALTHVESVLGGRGVVAPFGLVGVRALSVVSPKNQPFDLTFQGHTVHLTSAGTVRTGAAEDSRVYVSLADFVSWTGVQPSTIEVAASGSTEEISGIMRELAQAIPVADVRPVRQIMEGEARVPGKTRATLT